MKHKATSTQSAVTPSHHYEPIALSKLRVSKQNVREGTKPADISALAESIATVGLVHPLVVRKAGSVFAVDAGQRRLAALQLLAKAKRWPADRLVPCVHKDAEVDSHLVSLTENVHRVDMHPVDEFAAWKALADAGQSDEAIAAKFGVQPKVITRRLRLANLAPELLRACKQGEIDLEQLMALTVSPDHTAQLTAWKNAPAWSRTPRQLRAALTKENIASTHPLARFVGVAAYKKAGGHVQVDLFADDPDLGEDAGPASYLTNAALLMELAEKKARPIVTQEEKLGWRWVVFTPERQGGVCDKTRRISPKVKAPTKAQAKRVTAIEKRCATIDELLNNDDEQAASNQQEADALEAEYEALDAELDAIHEACQYFDQKQMSVAGVAIHLNYKGSLVIEHGLVRPDDWKAYQATLRQEQQQSEPGGSTGEGSETDNGAAAVEFETGKPLSAALSMRLAAHRTLGLRLALSEQPDVAIRVLTLRLCHLTLLSSRYEHDYAFDVEIRPSPSVDLFKAAPDLSESRASKALDTATQAWRLRLLADHTTPAEVVASLSDDETKALLALVTSLTYSSSYVHHDSKPDRSQQLAAALSLDMTKTWSPTVDSYFSHISKQQLLKIAEQIAPETVTSLSNLRKPELATKLASMVKDSGWLPQQLKG